MIVYNLAAEYASLFVVLVILISFTRDYDTKTKTYQFLRFVYIMVLASGLSTVAAIWYGVPGEGEAHITRAYVSNTIYFILLPIVSLCYVYYSVLIATKKLNKQRILRRVLLFSCPYILYVIVLLPNIYNGKVFYVTELEGYVRGEWFQLPYIIVGINIFFILLMAIYHRKRIYKEVRVVMTMTVFIAIIILYIQGSNPDTLLTGLLNTVSILSIHLYIQNVRKSTDSLTSLNNRISLMYRLGKWVKKDYNFSMYIFSIRSFKMINERYGLNFGDKVLVHISNGISSSFPEQAVFRYNGDEFAILIRKNARNVDHRMNRLINYLDKPFTIDNNKITLDFIYTRVDNKIFGRTVNELISAADYSISMLKNEHSERRFLYDPEIVKEIISKNEIIEKIKYAIAKDTFEVYYQPIYQVSTDSFPQAEALVRLRDREGTLIYPGEFIEIAEKTGLIVPMTYMILNHVCEDYRELMHAFGRGLSLRSIAINFPYLQFESPRMQEYVEDIMEKHMVDPKMIKIEITERALIEDGELVRHALSEMSKKGFVFELDDFGVDYSNIHTFLNLPINIIKLDRSLLLSSMDIERNKSFFPHLIEGIKVTDRRTIIEGVETKEQLDFVLKSGCDYIQGYYFSLPLRFADLKEFIKQQQGEQY